MIASEPGTINAAPAPCAKRATIRTSGVRDLGLNQEMQAKFLNDVGATVTSLPLGSDSSAKSLVDKFPVELDVDESFVVKIGHENFLDAGRPIRFWFGTDNTNGAPQCGPSYFESTACGLSPAVDLNALNITLPYQVSYLIYVETSCGERCDNGKVKSSCLRCVFVCVFILFF